MSKKPYQYGIISRIGRHKPCNGCRKEIRKFSIYTRVHTSAQKAAMFFCQKCEPISQADLYGL
jgi:hypothetical protein